MRFLYCSFRTIPVGVVLSIAIICWSSACMLTAKVDPCGGIGLSSTKLQSENSGCPTGVPTVTAPHLSKALSLKLPAPKLASDRSEIGLKSELSEFTLNDLETDLLIILVYDMYCHVCHQSAENMQWLADQVNDSLPERQFAVIGLGRGDTDFEVQTFKKKLKLNFVGIADRDKLVTDALGTKRTPSGYLLCKKSGEYKLLNTFEGYLSKSKAKEFLSPLGIKAVD